MLQLEDISIRQGEFSISHYNLHVLPKEYVVLMGKTGCGKTTILEVVCGLRRPQSGRVIVDGRDITSLVPADRNIAYVPQDAVLFEMMNVAENIMFPLKLRKWSKEERQHRCEYLCELMGISHLMNRSVEKLSGGEKQRVALARALSFEPQLICLDEPMSALDEETRPQMYELIRNLRKELDFTALHVSHSLSEAQALADRIVAFKEKEERL